MSTILTSRTVNSQIDQSIRSIPQFRNSQFEQVNSGIAQIPTSNAASSWELDERNFDSPMLLVMTSALSYATSALSCADMISVCAP